VNAKGQVKRPRKVRWRRPLRWRLVRWQSHWAFLIPIPKPSGTVRLQVGAGALAISGTCTLLEMAQGQDSWVATKGWRACWSVNLPLCGWRLLDRPQWLQQDGSWWIVVPVGRGTPCKGGDGDV